MAEIRQTTSSLAVPVSTSIQNSSSTGILSSPGNPEVLDTVLRVTTPENISFEYQLAGPFRRIIAYLLDLVISILGYVAVGVALYLVLIFAVMPVAATFGLSSLVESLMGMVSGILLVGFFIVYWFYGALMETYFNGQTYGKRWTQMRVLSVDGHSIDGVQATLRNFFRLLDISPLVPMAALFQFEESAGPGLPTCLFGLIMMTCSRRFQRIGDLVAGTVVVNETAVREPGLIVFTDPRVPSLAELIPNSFLATANLTKAVADYADQRRYLPPQRATEIAGYVARPLIERFGLLPDTDHDLFLCALYFKIFASHSASGERDDRTTASLVVTPGGRPIPSPMESSIPIASLSDSEGPT